MAATTVMAAMAANHAFNKDSSLTRGLLSSKNLLNISWFDVRKLVETGTFS